MKILYAGSFNPFHNGHNYIYQTACRYFGKENVWIGVGENKDKPKVNQDHILFQLKPITKNVIKYSGLTSAYAKTNGFDLLIRGVRAGDTLHESTLNYWNMKLTGVESLWIPSTSEYEYMSSSTLRELSNLGVDIQSMCPADSYLRWCSIAPSYTIYFGKSCSGKSSLLPSWVLNFDEAIWRFLPIDTSVILKQAFKEAFYSKDDIKIAKLTKEIGTTLNWYTLFSKSRVIDAAVIGSYWEYIPSELRARTTLVKLYTSEDNRKIFSEKRGVGSYFLEIADHYYKDPPYWDEEKEIKYDSRI